MKHSKYEKGQALILIVFAIFALVGLTGLTIEDDRKQNGKDEEEAHAPKEDLRAGELNLVGNWRHQMPF